MQSFLQKYSSAIHTFLATFIVTVLGAVTLIPADQILSPNTWTTALILGIITSAVRAGIKALSPLS
jgi:prepilin signal peptidase PulO-like enzyme (type II secretory pathway)